MELPIQLISTDFDGTLHSEFESPPVPLSLQELIGSLQAAGARWAINTGRDYGSLREGLDAARLSITPDYLVLVEREIYIREGRYFSAHSAWNDRCLSDHQALFERVRPDVPRLAAWVRARFDAELYADDWSPFCYAARNPTDAERIHTFLDDYCREVPELRVVRNDVYARFCHAHYNKGTALAEIARHAGIPTDRIFAAGDHLNDLPMLSKQYARWLCAPANAVPEVKESVSRQEGFVSPLPCGMGVESGLRLLLGRPARR